MTLSTHIKHVLLGLLAAAVLVVFLWKLLAYQEGQAHDQKILAEEKLKNDLALAKVQATATQTDTSALQQQISQLQQSNNALAVSMSVLRASLASQRATDAAASPTALSVRWQAIVGVGAVTPQGQSLLVDLPAAHATVDQLEQLPEVKAELVQVKANDLLKDQAMAQEQKVLGDAQAELATCKLVKTDADTVCVAKLKEQAAKARKRSIVYAVLAFVGGIFVRGKL
jgi:hypothetical protein